MVFSLIKAKGAEMSDFVWGLIIGVVILLFIMPIGESESEKDEDESKAEVRKLLESEDSTLHEYVNDPRFYHMPCNMYNNDD